MLNKMKIEYALFICLVFLFIPSLIFPGNSEIEKKLLVIQEQNGNRYQLFKKIE